LSREGTFIKRTHKSQTIFMFAMKSPVKAGKVEGWKKLIAGATGALVVVNAQWVANCFLLSLGP